MTVVLVELTVGDALQASSEASLQMTRKASEQRSWDHGGKSGRSQAERWGHTVVGLMGEIAACRVLNLCWTPGAAKITKGECGGKIEVRQTEHKHGNLPIYKTDKDDSWFVLAVGEYPTFHIHKAIKAGTGKKIGTWMEDKKPKCWYVSQSNIAKYGVDLRQWIMPPSGDNFRDDRQTSTQRPGTDAPVPAAQPDLSHLPPTDRWPDTEMGDRACQTPMGDRSRGGHRRQHGARPRFLSQG